ncbi:MAG: integrase arm-type DNA-binding domain-containing protein [Zoogloea sp.]|nr:integrase arm-type DNA-binding domain-containing protein [Zoogloea sp.]MCA0184870.1 integrase arm-type DNA-binding domain-containing protein [Pseudomonadota bacterium]
MALTDTAIKAAKPADKPVKMSDGDGLYLLIHPSGGKWWRFDYRFDGKRKTLSMGVYPEVSLRDARDRRDDARRKIANQIDPGEHRKANKNARADAVANSFETVAREWFTKMLSTWTPDHADKIIKRLERDVFPWMGDKPIADLSAPAVLTTIRRIEARGRLETAHRALQNCGQVFRYAVATGRAERDPTGDLRGALPPTREKHMAAITDPVEVGALLRAIDAFRGTLIVQSALKLSALVFVRPGELRQAEWAEIDLDKGEWNIPASRMKGWARKGITTPHLVPLAPQAVAILRDLQPLTGRGMHVFAGRDPKKPMSNAAVNAALRRMGYDTKTEMTGHGFRAMARTILHEELGVDREAIEHQLAHAVPDALGTAYNRTKFIKERRAMMQRWADYLDKLKTGADVVTIPTRAA